MDMNEDEKEEYIFSQKDNNNSNYSLKKQKKRWYSQETKVCFNKHNQKDYQKLTQTYKWYKNYFH